MQVTISGQHMDITPALREFVAEKVERIEKHFDHVTATHVVLNVEKGRHLAEATVSTRGATLHAKAEASEMYAAIDSLADKLDRQVLRHKEKLTDHHRDGGALKDQQLK